MIGFNSIDDMENHGSKNNQKYSIRKQFDALSNVHYRVNTRVVGSGKDLQLNLKTNYQQEYNVDRSKESARKNPRNMFTEMAVKK